MFHFPEIKPLYDNAYIVGTDRNHSKNTVDDFYTSMIREDRLLSSKTCVQGMLKFETLLGVTISAESRPVIFKEAKYISGHPRRYQRIKSDDRPSSYLLISTKSTKCSSNVRNE